MIDTVIGETALVLGATIGAEVISGQGMDDLGMNLQEMLGGLMLRVLPEGWYIPGMGVASAVAITILIGLLADLIGSSRRMLEDTLLRVRRLELRERD